MPKDVAVKKNKGGRPRKYSDTKQMEIKIAEYFKTRIPTYITTAEGEIMYNSKGMPIVKDLNAPSLAGLALFLGYADRQSIYDNEKREEFSCVIKKARSMVEEWVYQHTLDGTLSPPVGIFILKQFGYTDRQTLEHELPEGAGLVILRGKMGVDEWESQKKIEK